MEKLCPIIFGVLTLLLVCSGTFSPGWLVFDTSSISGIQGHDTSNGVTLHMGIFYMLVIGENYSMVASYYDSNISGNEVLTSGLLEYQIEACLGIVLCFISVIFLFAYNRNKTPNMLLAPAIMFLIGGIATLVAVGRFLQVVLILALGAGLPMSVPYSIILSGLGAIILIILSIILFVMFCQHNKDRHGNQTQGGVVFSNVPMSNYPQQGQPPPQYAPAETKLGDGYSYNMYGGLPPKM